MASLLVDIYVSYNYIGSGTRHLNCESITNLVYSLTNENMVEGNVVLLFIGAFQSIKMILFIDIM